MKRTKFLIIGIIILLILITSCSSTNISGNISKEDIDKVRNTTYDDVVKKLSDIINDFIDEHSYFSISNIEFIEDKLAVDDKNEVKKFNNIKIVLNIDVNSEETPIDLKEEMTISEKSEAFKEFTSNMNRELLDKLHIESNWIFKSWKYRSIIYR